MPPSVGLPTEGAGCAFQVSIDQPACGAPCTQHLFSNAPGWGMVTLATCDDHVGIALASAPVVTMHAFHADCRTNSCVAVPDDRS